MKNVRDILGKKNGAVVSIAPDATVFSALELMAQKNIGSLLVMEGGKLVGIMSERDYARKVILVGKASGNTQVKEIMSPVVVVVQPSTTIEECMALMIGKSVRYLPVMEDGKVTGVISIGNVIDTIISEQNVIISNLQQYIMQG